MTEAKKPGTKQAAEKPEKLLKSGVPASVGKKTQFKKGQSGNPAGLPKGHLHLSTHIQNLLNDEEFETYLQDPRHGFVEYKGAPIKAILKVLAIKAMQGDTKAFDALAKYGYGTKVELVGKDDAPILAIVEFVNPPGDIKNAASGDGVPKNAG